MPYVFYDTETTGTKTAFDQILQFAAIKTDDELREVDRFNIRCRLLPHIVPSPGAMRATGVTPAMLTDPVLPSHYEAIRQVRAKLLAWSPASFVGYNSIAFDEELLRQALFQTLHPAYLTNTNGNARSDLMRIAHAASVYAPNAISVPIDERGKQTFKLDRLAPANGYAHDHAHEAMADVAATIHIARLIRGRAPDIWRAMLRTSKKAAVKAYATEEPELSLTEYQYGRAASWLVTFCGEDPGYDGQLAVFDLQYNPDDYRSLPLDELIKVLNATAKVIRPVRANAQPILMPAAAAPDTAVGAQVPAAERERRVKAIRDDADFRARVGQALANRFAGQKPSPYVEQRIYDGFPAPRDQGLMDRFQNADWPERTRLAVKIEDARLSEFAYRLVYFERPELLSEAKQTALKSWTADRVLTTDESVPWLTVSKALREADDLMKDANRDDTNLLQGLKDFLYTLADRHGAG
jgi:exodeoxyribonuclease I